MNKLSIVDKDNLIKQTYELVKDVELSLLLTGNLCMHKGIQPEILTGKRISLPEKGENEDIR